MSKQPDHGFFRGVLIAFLIVIPFWAALLFLIWVVAS